MTKRTLRIQITNVLVSLLAAIITSCIYDYDYSCNDNGNDNEGKLKVRIDVDWSNYDDELPSGMTVAIYPTNSNEPITITTNNINQVRTSLSPGLYHIEVMNYSKSEFGTLVFLEDSYGNPIGIQAKQTTTSWYIADDDEVVAYEPEAFAFERQTNVTVPEENNNIKSRSNDEILIATLQPVNIIHTVSVNVRLKGFKNLRSCAGAIQGMASAINYKTMRSSYDTDVTHLLESWSFVRDTDESDSGVLTSTFKSFGLSSDNTGIAEDNTLKLTVQLVDNKTILNYVIHVGDKITKTGTRTYSFDVTDVIILPETEASNSSGESSGFDVIVDDWSDEEDVGIEI
jgi:hypothetical protein